MMPVHCQTFLKGICYDLEVFCLIVSIFMTVSNVTISANTCMYGSNEKSYETLDSILEIQDANLC